MCGYDTMNVRFVGNEILSGLSGLRLTYWFNSQFLYDSTLLMPQAPDRRSGLFFPLRL